MAEDRRGEVIQIRLSVSEKEEVRRRASALGLDISEYGRLRMLRDEPPTMAVGSPVVPKPPERTAVIAVAPRMTEVPQRGHLRPAPMGSLLKGAK
jgi:hypothetical protein